MNIKSIRVGDCYIPDLTLPEEPRPIGRWGRMHRDYLILNPGDENGIELQIQQRGNSIILFTAALSFRTMSGFLAFMLMVGLLGVHIPDCRLICTPGQDAVCCAKSGEHGMIHVVVAVLTISAHTV